MGLSSLDFAARKKLYNDLQALIADDVPALFYSYDYYRAALSYRVHFDFEKALPGIYLYRNITKWELRP